VAVHPGAIWTWASAGVANRSEDEIADQHSAALLSCFIVYLLSAQATLQRNAEQQAENQVRAPDISSVLP
jgi:hypothetical protein